MATELSKDSGPTQLGGLHCVQIIRSGFDTYGTVAVSATSLPENPVRQVIIAISGMSCGGCVSAVRKALDKVPGIRVDAVTVGFATVSYDATRTSPAAITQAVRDAGYQPVTSGAPVAAAAARGACCGDDTERSGSCCG